MAAPNYIHTQLQAIHKDNILKTLLHINIMHIKSLCTFYMAVYRKYTRFYITFREKASVSIRHHDELYVRAAFVTEA